jgi:hypothetical protein
MTVSERASQIWSVLALCATKRQTLLYDELSRLIGVPLPGLGQLLEPIQSYCLIHGKPPLTSIVVGRNSGVPGEGFIAGENVPKAQADVFNNDWLALSPSSEELGNALTELPTRNRTLSELEQILNHKRAT